MRYRCRGERPSPPPRGQARTGNLPGADLPRGRLVCSRAAVVAAGCSRVNVTQTPSALSGDQLCDEKCGRVCEAPDHRGEQTALDFRDSGEMAFYEPEHKERDECDDHRAIEPPARVL